MITWTLRNRLIVSNSYSMTGRSTYVELKLIDVFENVTLTAEWLLRITVGVTPQSLTCLKNEYEVVNKSSM